MGPSQPLPGLQGAEGKGGSLKEDPDPNPMGTFSRYKESLRVIFQKLELQMIMVPAYLARIKVKTREEKRFASSFSTC